MRWSLAVAALIIASCTTSFAGVARADYPSSATSAFECDLAARIANADAYLAGRPRSIGYVLRDRKTGAM